MRSAFFRTAAVALMLLASWGGARAQEAPAVEVSEGPFNVGFKPPPDCQEVTEELKALVSKEGVKFKYGCVTPQKDTLVFLTMTTNMDDEKGLADFERGFKDSQNARHPGVKWLGRDKVKISGGEWVRLRFREGPAENSFVNHVYITDWAGEIIVFFIGAPASQYERLKAGLEKSAKSMQVSITVNVPAVGEKP